MGWLHIVLVRLYPKHWRERYAQEFLELLAEAELKPTDYADIVLAALYERAYTPISPRNLTFMGGLGALCALLLSLLILFNMEQAHPQVTLILMGMPLLMLGVVRALHIRFRQACPHKSQLAQFFGMLGGGVLLVLFALFVVSGNLPSLGRAVRSTSLLWTALFLVGFTFITLWVMLAGYIGLRTKRLHWALGLCGIVSGGLSLLLVVVGGVIFTVWTPNAAWELMLAFATAIWVLSSMAWSGGIAWTLLCELYQPRTPPQPIEYR